MVAAIRSTALRALRSSSSNRGVTGIPGSSTRGLGGAAASQAGNDDTAAGSGRYALAVLAAAATAGFAATSDGRRADCTAIAAVVGNTRFDARWVSSRQHVNI